MNVQQEVIKEFGGYIQKHTTNIQRIRNNVGKIKDSYSKLSGMIAAKIIKTEIDKVIACNDLPYKTTEYNVYINSCFTEWDLLIVKKEASIQDDLAIYELKDVLAVVECKAYGLFFTSKDNTYNPLRNFLASYKMLKEKNENLRSIYITISEQFPKRHSSISYIDLTRKAMFEGTGRLDNIFCFSKNREIPYLDNGYEWEEFIINVLK